MNIVSMPKISKVFAGLVMFCVSGTAAAYQVLSPGSSYAGKTPSQNGTLPGGRGPGTRLPPAIRWAISQVNGLIRTITARCFFSPDRTSTMV